MPIEMTREEYEKKYGQQPVTSSTAVREAALADYNAQNEGVTFASSPDDSGFKAGLKAIGNVPGSAVRFGKNIFSAVASPVDTTKGLFNAVTGGGRAIQRGIRDATGAETLFAVPENEVADETFDALKTSLNERYGSLEAAQKTATNDPIGFGADVAAIFSGAGATATGGRIANAARRASNTARTAVAAKADKAAISQMQKAMNLNPSDTRRIKQPNIYGDEPARFMIEKGIKGSQESMVNQLDDLRFNSKTQVDEGLAQLTTRVSGDTVVPARQTLDALKQTFDGTIGNEQLVARLDTWKAQDSYSLAELNEIKRLAQSQLDVYKTTGVLKDSAKAKGLNNVMQDLKTTIEDQAALQGFDNVKALNKDTQVAYEISQSLQKRLDTTSKLPEIKLTDAVLAGGGWATGTLPLTGGIILSKKVLESARFRSYLANRLSGESAAKKAALQQAVETGNYTEVVLYLAPIVNEYEASQQIEPQQ